jgi:hypothetical protein
MNFVKKAVVASSGAVKKAGAVIALAALSGAAMAQETGSAGPDLSALTSKISVGTTITAVLAIGVTMVGLHLAVKGAKIVLNMVKSA